jgi:hypothetical protein
METMTRIPLAYVRSLGLASASQFEQGIKGFRRAADLPSAHCLAAMVMVRWSRQLTAAVPEPADWARGAEQQSDNGIVCFVHSMH